MKAVNNLSAIVVCFILLSGCSIFKKKDVVRKAINSEVVGTAKSDIKLNTNTNISDISTSQVLSTDDYDITIDNGKVNIAQDGTVTAEGSNIKAKAKRHSNELKRDSIQTNIKESITGQSKSTLTEKLEQKIVEKHKDVNKDSSIKGWIGAAVFILIIFIAIVIIRRVRKL